MPLSGIIKVSGMIVLLALSMPAQLAPEAAHVLMYFPQLADGGPPEGQWQTRLTFINPNPTGVSATIAFHSDSGAPLALDFGDGSKSQIDFSIPANGTRVFSS